MDSERTRDVNLTAREGPMTPHGAPPSAPLRVVVVLATGTLAAASGLGAQTLRVAVWGSYDGVTGSEDWSAAGTQLTLAATRGDAAWVAGERLGRFGAVDAIVRIGGVLHPSPRWWITLEAGRAPTRPAFMPQDIWEADVTALATRRVALGLGYRRWSYPVGAVDILTPHVTIETGDVSWDLRVPISRNPTERIDAACSLRATTSQTSRVSGWVLGAAGRESYVVQTLPTVELGSLETVTGAAGLRYNAGGGVTFTIDANVVRSKPLARRGVRLAIEKEF